MGIPDEVASIVARIKQCRFTRGVANAHRLHAEAVRAGLERDTRVGNSLVQLFGSSGSLTQARLVFDRIAARDDLSWTFAIAAHIRNGQLDSACDMFGRMPHTGVLTWNTVVTGLAQKGCLQQARGCFDSCPERNHVTWNALITAYAQNGHLETAGSVLKNAPQFHVVSWTVMVSALIHKGRMQDAKNMFDVMPERDVVASTIMFSAYAQRGHLLQAKQLFDSMPVKDAASWTMMLQSYARNGRLDEARKLLDVIPDPELRCYNSMLAAYAHAGELRAANELFEAMQVRDMITWTTMVTAYAQSGQMLQAKRMFDATPVHERDAPAWSAMITGYGQSGYHREALALFLRMDHEAGGTPTNQSFLIAIGACSNLHAVAQGRILHEEAVRSGSRGNEVELFNVLVTMYGCFGDLLKAKALFDEAPVKDLISWTALLTAFAQNGQSRETRETYWQMLAEGVEPDEVAFVSLLSACSHAGLVEDGISYLVAMVEFHGMQPNERHLSCMVDLLARAGRVQNAHEFLARCKSENAWMAMAGLCLVQGDVQGVGYVVERAIDPSKSSFYVILSQTHAQQEQQEQQLRRIADNG